MIRVLNLHFTLYRKHTSIIKEGEETKTKTYMALVWVSEPVTVEQYKNMPFRIDQMTPIRL